MRRLYNPSPGLEIWIVFLFLNFFPTLLDVWDVITFFDNLLRRIAGITFIRTKALHNVIWTVDHDLIKYSLKLADVMSVCSCYDYR